MQIIDFCGKQLKIMEEIIDEKYGRVWYTYYDHKKVYIIEGKVVEEQSIIDDLDNKYGRPVDERDIIF